MSKMVGQIVAEDPRYIAFKKKLEGKTLHECAETYALQREEAELVVKIMEERRPK